MLCIEINIFNNYQILYIYFMQANLYFYGSCDAYMIPIFPQSHASFIEALPATNASCSGICGNLILAYFSGQGEGDNGTGIVTTILQEGITCRHINPTLTLLSRDYAVG